MEENTGYTFLVSFVPLIIIIFALWFILIRPQKKKDQKVQQMRNSLQPGDEVITIGGIVGKILSVKDDSLVIYCGSDKTKLEFKKWAISEVTKKSDKPSLTKETKEVKDDEPEDVPQKKKIKKLVRKEDAVKDEEESAGQHTDNDGK